MGPCESFTIDFPLPVTPYSVLVAMSPEPIHDVGPFGLLPLGVCCTKKPLLAWSSPVHGTITSDSAILNTSP